MKRIYASIIFLMMAVAVFAQTDGNGSGFNEMVAIVESRLGSGTGFLVRTEDAVWLYTNEHVLRWRIASESKIDEWLGFEDSRVTDSTRPGCGKNKNRGGVSGI